MAVLSIQSHVVFGYAGNTAAVFPLQRLGREVWAINTVEFSNHTGYGAHRGKVLEAGLVSELVTGLEERGVLGRCEAVLSGYLGDAAAGEAVIDAVKKTRAKSPGVLYCCDPVMGDTGRGFYVKSGIPEMFKNELVPLADIVCPNQFEMEALTGVKTETLRDAVKAVDMLHEAGPSVVLVTSFRETDGEIGMLASDKKNIFKISTPELPLGGGVAGTGDMTTAVFLSRYLEEGNIQSPDSYQLEKALELCTASVYGVLEASYNESITENSMPVELNFIKSQNELVSPSLFFKAVRIGR
ncbi:MAG: pyridoxal kinase PdxY [Treponema sp.]|jgi:pyridoxine kinase|nr:pyridoxal kinase PdxY [Treponema sp.]